MNEPQTKLPSDMNADEFQQWLEMEPDHKEVSEDGSYLHVPIGYLEPDLRFTFNGKLKIKIKDIKEMFGATVLHIRMKVFHPVHKIWLKYDGIAAIPIEGEKPGEYKGSVKTLVLDEMKTGVASCYSEAIKNAAKKIGKRFGSDLNRVNKPGNTKPDKAEVKKKAVNSRVQSLIDDCTSIAELNSIISELPSSEEVQQALNKKLTSLKKSK